MAVIGRADREGVNCFSHFIKHLAKVVILFRIGPADGGRVQILLVDIADGDDIAGAPGVLRIARPFAANADAGELNLLIGCPAFARGNAAQGPIAGADHGGSLEEAATVTSAWHELAPMRLIWQAEYA